jgi:hypothetical protein
MPSFFQSMGRIFSGKPVYDASDIQNPQNPSTENSSQAPTPEPGQEQAPQPTIRKGDANTYPVVFVKHFRTHLDNGHMDVSCVVANTCSEDIMIEKIRLLGTTYKLEASLHPGGEREYIVYKGPALLNQGDPHLLLDYKTMREGDYFETLHEVLFKYLPDKTYDIADIRFLPPVRDIYG